MLSIHFLRLLAEERERELQQELRIRRLLRADDVADATDGAGQTARYRASWRARTPRASATTR
ncbi:MAG TPA: hypothetical protein VL749_09380, partial [Patescibacteria group bacterium]|nr:hypothetical protein [Patescibacteria group bacterium]